MADRVVVGVDGSPQAEQAVRWAAVEAGRMGWRLLLVAACDATGAGYTSALGPPNAVIDGVVAQAHEFIDTATQVAVETVPSVSVESTVVEGNPSAVLRDMSERSDVAVVVVGSRGRGPLKAAVLGSVSSDLTTHGQCPVVVVRDGGTPDGRIVVGVDGTAGSRAATAAAFEHAEAAGVPLAAVYSYCEMRVEGVHGLGLSTAQHDAIVERLAGEAQDRLSGWLADHRAAHPTVTVERSVAPEGPALRILTAARDAQLVVLGHRGRHSALGTALGSTVHTVLHTSTCPVMVVRDRSTGHPGGMP